MLEDDDYTPPPPSPEWQFLHAAVKWVQHREACGWKTVSRAEAEAAGLRYRMPTMRSTNGCFYALSRNDETGPEEVLIAWTEAP